MDGAGDGREGSETEGAWVWTGLWMERKGGEKGGAWVWTGLGKEGRGASMSVDGAADGRKGRRMGGRGARDGRRVGVDGAGEGRGKGARRGAWVWTGAVDVWTGLGREEGGARDGRCMDEAVGGRGRGGAWAWTGLLSGTKHGGGQCCSMLRGRTSLCEWSDLARLIC